MPNPLQCGIIACRPAGPTGGGRGGNRHGHHHNHRRHRPLRRRPGPLEGAFGGRRLTATAVAADLLACADAAAATAAAVARPTVADNNT